MSFKRINSRTMSTAAWQQVLEREHRAAVRQARFRDLVTRQSPFVFRVAYSQDAEDVVQETLSI